MELLISIAYFTLVWLIFINYKLLRFSLLWKFVVFGIWIGALLTEVLALGQFAPYSKSAFVQTYVVQMAPQWGGLVKEVYVKPNVPIKKGDPLFQMDPDEKAIQGRFVHRPVGCGGHPGGGAGPAVEANGCPGAKNEG